MNELNITTTAKLSDEDLRVLIAVASALHGVRMDLTLQEILDIVVEMYNNDHPFDEIGLSILSAMKGPPEEDLH